MTRIRATVDPGMTIIDAAALMGREAVGAALVLEDGRLVGIFTERDILKAVGQPGFGPQVLVMDRMTKDPQTIGLKADVEEARVRMVENNFRHLPIVDEAGEPVGMLSMRDLVGSFRTLRV